MKASFVTTPSLVRASTTGLMVRITKGQLSIIDPRFFYSSLSRSPLPPAPCPLPLLPLLPLPLPLSPSPLPFFSPLLCLFISSLMKFRNGIKDGTGVFSFRTKRKYQKKTASNNTNQISVVEDNKNQITTKQHQAITSTTTDNALNSKPLQPTLRADEPPDTSQVISMSARTTDDASNTSSLVTDDVDITNAGEDTDSIASEEAMASQYMYHLSLPSFISFFFSYLLPCSSHFFNFYLITLPFIF